MAIFRQRLPSRREMGLAFAACVFSIFSWTILQFLDRLPAWLFYLKPWEIVSMFAYTQLFALLESIVFLFVLVSLAVIAPNRFVRGKFVALAVTGILLTAVWLAGVQYRNELGFLERLEMPVWLGVLLYGLSITLVWAVTLRFQQVKTAVESLADRLFIFLYVYLPVSLAGAVIVILRNVI